MPQEDDLVRLIPLVEFLNFQILGALRKPLLVICLLISIEET